MNAAAVANAPHLRREALELAEEAADIFEAKGAVVFVKATRARVATIRAAEASERPA